MYEHQLKDMALAVGKALRLDAVGIKRAQNALQSYWDRQGVAITWSIEDVKDQAKQLGYRALTNAEARLVLRETVRRHDATIGINWDVIVSAMAGLGYDRLRRAKRVPEPLRPRQLGA